MEQQIQLREDRIEYKIEITKIVNRDYIDQEQILVEERHYTDEELKQYATRRDSVEEYTKKVYGNKPVLCAKEIKTKILEQTVSDLSLAGVIRAINGI